MVVNGNTLLASNLGDSGFIVIRSGAVFVATQQQQHKFNFPYQIGGKDAMGDHPSVAQVRLKRRLAWRRAPFTLQGLMRRQRFFTKNIS